MLIAVCVLSPAQLEHVLGFTSFRLRFGGVLRGWFVPRTWFDRVPAGTVLAGTRLFKTRSDYKKWCVPRTAGTVPRTSVNARLVYHCWQNPRRWLLLHCLDDTGKLPALYSKAWSEFAYLHVTNINDAQWVFIQNSNLSLELYLSHIYLRRPYGGRRTLKSVIPAFAVEFCVGRRATVRRICFTGRRGGRRIIARSYDTL